MDNIFSKKFPGYDVDEKGNVYKNGNIIKQFNSNNYKQVLLFDENHKRYVCGVHTAVAMKYLNYFDGCIVHHKDENRSNNNLENLEVMSMSEHARQHQIKTIKEGTHIFLKLKGKSSWNHGMKMSKEFCETMSRVRKQYFETHPNKKFAGNQYVNADGTRKNNT